MADASAGLIGPLSVAMRGVPRSLDDDSPATIWAQKRNTALDWLFYDVGNLTASEYAMLVGEPNREGSILVVWPSGIKDDIGVRKYADHAELKAQPGKMLSRFAIAGVGSSDVGAAAFARTVADRYQEPVGAIVAGYGTADLLAEAMGGWFVLGGANRLMGLYHDFLGKTDRLAEELRHQSPQLSGQEIRRTSEALAGHNDSSTLFKLLLDEDRKVVSVAGHSKGSLSIAYALETLTLLNKNRAIARAKEMRITTVGTVVSLPSGFKNVGQYLGDLDWFGGINSRPDVPHKKVSMALHHLNPKIGMHLDFAAVLAQEPD